MNDKYKEFFKQINTFSSPSMYEWFSEDDKEMIYKLLHKSDEITPYEYENIYKKSINNTPLQRALVLATFVPIKIIGKVLMSKPEKIVFKDALSVALPQDLLEVCVKNLGEETIENMFEETIKNKTHLPIDETNINTLIKVMPDKFHHMHFEFGTNKNIFNDLVIKDDLNEEMVSYIINNKNLSIIMKDTFFTNFDCDISKIRRYTPLIAEQIYKSSAEAIFDFKDNKLDSNTLLFAEENIKQLLANGNLSVDLQHDLYMRLMSEKDTVSKNNMLVFLTRYCTDKDLAKKLISFSLQKNCIKNPIITELETKEFVLNLHNENKELFSEMKKDASKSATNLNKIKNNQFEITKALTRYKINDIENVYKELLDYHNEDIKQQIIESPNTPISILEELSKNDVIASLNVELQKTNIDPETIEEVIEELNNETPFSGGHGTCSTTEKQNILSAFKNVYRNTNEENKKFVQLHINEINEEINRECSIKINKPEWIKYAYEFNIAGITPIIDAKKYLNAPIMERKELLDSLTISSLKKEMEHINYLFSKLDDKMMFYEIIDDYIKVYDIFKQKIQLLEKNLEQEKENIAER